jgi:parallel beta-helix repeat protein
VVRSLGALVSATLAAVLVPVLAGAAPGPGCAGAQVRYASTSNTIYVTGPVTCTLSDLVAFKALAKAPLRLADPGRRIWSLGANLKLEQGARLNLHGSAAAGDVNELRLRSDPTVFVWVRAEWGTIDLDRTKVTSWNDAAGGPDLDYAGNKRAFIHVRSLRDPATQQARESTMNIADSDVGYLGTNAAESYGLVWKVSGTPTADLFANVDVYGQVTGSRLHHNYFGAYTYGANGMLWEGNELDHNVKYGLDPHDDSDSLTIRDNFSHDNGDHGIICSQRCDDLTIEHNRSVGNTGHGIMLHRNVTASVVADNVVQNNTDTGIALFESHGNTVEGNTVSGNLRGIRLSVGSADNRISDNDVSGNKGYGIYLYKGSDAPTTGDGRPKRNTFAGNRVTGNASYAVYLADSDANTFTDSTFSGNARGLYLGRGTGNRVDGLRPDKLTVESYGEPGKQATATLAGFDALVVKPNADGVTTLDGGQGQVFDPDERLATTVTTGGSRLVLTWAGIGTQSTVLTRRLRARTSTGSATVEPLGWITGKGLRLEWTAKPGSITQALSFVAGDLMAHTKYRVTRNGTSLGNFTADDNSEISFGDVPGTTAAVSYVVVPL